jgi:hypothetical protein
VKEDKWRAPEKLMHLLKTCVARPPLCEHFAYFMPNFITSVTDGIESAYCFNREEYTNQIKNACMLLDFALHAEDFKEALPLLEHMENHPMAYPAELFVLHFPPNKARLGEHKLTKYYNSCLKELESYVAQNSGIDTGSASIPVDKLSINHSPSKRGTRGYYSYRSYASAPPEKINELLSFLGSEELSTKLQLFKKDQDGISSLIQRHGLPVDYSFGRVSSRYYVAYLKDLKTSKRIRLKRLQDSKKAIAQLKASTKATKGHTMA